jgi:hypothetical protein
MAIELNESIERRPHARAFVLERLKGLAASPSNTEGDHSCLKRQNARIRVAPSSQRRNTAAPSARDRPTIPILNANAATLHVPGKPSLNFHLLFPGLPFGRRSASSCSVSKRCATRQELHLPRRRSQLVFPRSLCLFTLRPVFTREVLNGLLRIGFL